MNIVVFRALKLGDLLCTVPAFRALRKAFPKAHISLMSLPWASSFVERYQCYIDGFISFPGYPGLPEQPLDLPAIDAFFYEMKKSRIDLLLQMQGNGTIVNEMLDQLKPKCLAGFCLPTDPRIHSKNFLEYPEELHEIKRHLALLHHLGIPDDGSDIDFPTASTDQEDLRKIDFSTDSKYICVHPGSALASRQWPPELFAKISAHFFDKGFKIVLTGSSGEASLTNQVNLLLQNKAIDLAGVTTLGSLALMLRRSSGLISNCTGVSHLAAAEKTKSIVISMDGEPHRWGPLDKSLHKTIDWLKDNRYENVLTTAEQLFV